MRAPILAAILASLPALAAAAEPPPAPAPAIAPEQAVSTPAYAPGERGRAEDPNSDRMFLLPSAETQPAGTIAFNDYELLFLGVTYAVSDNFQITGQALTPVVREMPIVLNASGKLVVLRQERLRLALQGGVSYFNENDEEYDSEASRDDVLMVLSGGVIASACLDTDCHSLATGSITGVKPFSQVTGDDDFALLYSAGITARTGQHVKVLLEVTSAGITDGSGFEAGGGALVSYGLRFFNESLAADVGFVKPFSGGDGDDDDIFLLGVPFLNFTYRQ